MRLFPDALAGKTCVGDSDLVYRAVSRDPQVKWPKAVNVKKWLGSSKTCMVHSIVSPGETTYQRARAERIVIANLSLVVHEKHQANPH